MFHSDEKPHEIGILRQLPRFEYGINKGEYIQAGFESSRTITCHYDKRFWPEGGFRMCVDRGIVYVRSLDESGPRWMKKSSGACTVVPKTSYT